ncbi:RICIN domain-containing protein [Streptomyces sp. NBC_00847]|uniref:RICIN domain-containing protein n=1 Tax=Streptomyces sp. NBC_00847 TaxID=2975850 RepID=UPI002252A9C7|nr:RICIN domain-containing protein [Streptomyces sp. NBC_00847]MCX4882223.1 RICIN domain-containing protein [Streptomyces sp. NBC_00847]
MRRDTTRTTRTRSVLATGLVGALMSVAGPTVAEAHSPRSDGWGQPVPLSKVLDGSTSQIQAATFGIGNLKSGKFLQATSTANGAKVVQQKGSQANPLQNWVPVNDSPYTSFENASAGRNLGVDGASTASGAAAIIANGSGDANQDWLLVPVSGYPDGFFAMKNHKSGLCLGISGASTTNGAQAAQFKCDGSENQGWALFNH